MAKQNKLHIDKIRKNFDKLKHDLPIIIGNTGQNFFRSSFEKQGWTDESFHAWKQVQRRTPGTKAYKYPKEKDLSRRTRGILIGNRAKGGEHLRDSVNRSLKKSTWDAIEWSVPQKYAAAHNQGLMTRNFTMPQRKFMGTSKTLLNNIKDKIEFALRQLIK